MANTHFWSFQIYHKLGDALCVLYMLENIGRATGKQSIISDSAICSQICDLMEIEYVSCEKTRQKGVRLGSLHNRYIRKRHFICSVQNYLKNKMDFNPLDCKPLIPKVKTKAKNKITLVQLDGRTIASHGVAMRCDTMRHAINHLTENRVALIGGTDTKKYLGEFYEYRLGPLDYLLKEIQSCDEFIGSDSGMSHLAGVLGVKSKTILLHPSVCLSDVYSMYRNTEVFCLSDSKCTHNRTKLQEMGLRFL